MSSSPSRWRGAAVMALAVLGACATEDPGITPARDRFYFPSVLALDPEWPVLYVANSNADLKYNGATVEVIKLDRLPADLTEVGKRVNAQTLSCHVDPFDRTIWECYEEQFVDPTSTIKIGDLPADLTVTPAKVGDQPRARRIFVPVRGANKLVWATVEHDQKTGRYDLRCTSSSQGSCAPGAAGDCEIWDCDDAHKVDYSTDRKKQLPSEPFGIAYNPLTAVWVGEDGSRRTCLDDALPAETRCECGSARACAGEKDVGCCVPPPQEGSGAAPANGAQQVVDHIYVSHSLNGEVSFFASGPSGVALRDFRGGFFTPVDVEGTLIYGGFGLATRTPGDPRSLTYVSSHVDSNLASFSILEDHRIIDATRAPMAGVVSPANDVRGLAFGPGGDRLYVVNRLPSTLVAVDMTRQSGGLPKQEPLWAVPVCSEPSVLRLGPDPLHPEDRLARLAYVVCFSAGQIFVVDTALGRVVDQIITGKGPNGLVIDSKNKRAFVANFLDNTVGVIDLDPSHPSYNRMVLRIGHNEYLIRSNQ